MYSPAKIIDTGLIFWDITIEELESGRSTTRIASGRMAISNALRSYTNLSMKDIANYCGYKNHSSIYSSIKVCDHERLYNTKYGRMIRKYENNIKNRCETQIIEVDEWYVNENLYL